MARKSSGFGRGSRTIGTAGARTGTSKNTRMASGRRRVIVGPMVSSRPILPVIVRAELAGLERTPPRVVVAIPVHRGLQGGGEGVAGHPAELPELGAIQRVATVVGGSIGHRLDKALGLTGQAQDLAGQGEVLCLVAAAECGDL